MPQSETIYLEKIISGGQTGVDRAALDVGLVVPLPIGGWCPKGRRAEDGVIGSEYPLQETPGDDYEQRTEFNVRDADATLIIAQGELTGGTALTLKLAEQYDRPRLVVDPDAPDACDRILRWLGQAGIKVLNVAGPRESGAPGIYSKAAALLRRVMKDAGPTRRCH